MLYTVARKTNQKARQVAIIYVFSWDLRDWGFTPEDPLNVRVLQADVVHVPNNPAMGYVPEK